jgi:menaquinone-dependent protoporphyrinogen oxidase
MPRTLIAYSTVDGHTLKICRRLKDVLDRNGHTSELLDLDALDPHDLTAFDQVVIGASIRYGKYRPSVYRFVQINRAAIDQMPSAFFAVNVVARKPGKDTPELNPYVKAFERKSNWRPRQLAVFAGKLDYPSYGFLDRQMIRLIMWLTDGPTEATTSIDFTDWQAVDEFGLRLASMGSASTKGVVRTQSSASVSSDA